MKTSSKSGKASVGTSSALSVGNVSSGRSIFPNINTSRPAQSESSIAPADMSVLANAGKVEAYDFGRDVRKVTYDDEAFLARMGSIGSPRALRFSSGQTIISRGYSVGGAGVYPGQGLFERNTERSSRYSVSGLKFPGYGSGQDNFSNPRTYSMAA